MKFLKPLAGVLSISLIAGSFAAQADTVSISTLPPGALLNIQAQTVAKVVQEHTDLQMRVVTYNDAAATMASANVGQTEFAYASNDGAGDAVMGVAEHEGKAMENLRVVAAMSPIRIGLMVRKDSDIQTVADLEGKRYPTGWQGLKEGIVLSNALLSTAGLSLDDVDGVSTLNLIRAADDFKAGRLDATFFAVGAPKVAEIDAAIGLRFLDLPDDEAAQKAMASFRPEYTLEEVEPAPNYAGIDGPTTLMTYYIILLANKDTDDEVVKSVAKALHENKAALVAGHPTFNGMNPQGMANPQPRLEYHPGAIAFYKEAGIWQE